ncbi:MAG TPA: rod shape-determining protein MreD [Rhodospirillaceae bacterium]|nr:rod shape-determining protein MreD [Rhodospirillaceae bacterium]
MSTLAERLDYSGRILLPYCLMALLLVFNTVSFSYPLVDGVKAPLLLMAVFYWSIFRPTIVPGWLVFLAGIVLDILSGLPMGMNALVFVAVTWIVGDQRRFLMGQPFTMVWSGFCMVSVASGLVQWFLYGLIHLQWTPLYPVIASAVLGIMLFPFVNSLLHLTHKFLPVRSASFG